MATVAADASPSGSMQAMVLDSAASSLQLRRLPMPEPNSHEVRIRVSACAVCRTDLHILDRDLPALAHPIVPGHEVVGAITQLGAQVTGLTLGQRVGVPWLGWCCGECAYCRAGRENLCDRAEFTGYHRAGGYAEHIVADARFVFPIPNAYSDCEAAPLLCAGLIGYRALTMAGDAKRLGLYGFGAAAQLLTQIAGFRNQDVYAFSRPGDAEGQALARELGAVWAGGSDAEPPHELEAAIILAPAGELVPVALRAVCKGGTVVCAGIHMSAIPSFPYALLWGERRLLSVANLTRRDGLEFFELAARTRIQARIEKFPLADANTALKRLRAGSLHGIAVLEIGS